MNIKNILLSLSILLSTVACVNASDNAALAKGYTVKVTTNLQDSSLVILSRITDTKLDITDSAYVQKGSFSFAGEAPTESTLYYITFGTTQPPGIPVILENGAKVNMNITKGSTYEVTIDGGKYNKEMLTLYNTYTSFEAKMAAFNAEVAAIDPTTVTEELRQNTTKRYGDMVKQRSTNIENFIKNEKATPATYFAVKYLFNKPNPKLILLASDKMEKTMPESSYTKNLQALAKQLGPTVPGAMAPEINLYGTDRTEQIALSSLRGKVVLIDFWASWCGPCRRENPAVKAIYEKYKDKGFEIYGVSLDNNLEQWKAAIAKDGLTWKHVSELKGWSSTPGKIYGVRSVPSTFLIDRDGRIVKSNFRSHELEGLLKELLD